MKNKIQNQPFEMITREVTRIRFGNGNPSETRPRLTRMALEHSRVPDMIRRVRRKRMGKTNRCSNPPAVGVSK